MIAPSPSRREGRKTLFFLICGCKHAVHEPAQKMPQTIETWTIRKPAVEAHAGLVASQHYAAADIGARVLTDGGNAVDAAVTAGLAIGTVEPWMSGLGGGGCMLIYVARERAVHAIDFGMRAPRSLDPAEYPLVEGRDSDLFGWPAVLEDRNVTGPFSFAVPGFVAGHALALERFGTYSWQQALGPAIELATAGLAVDWYATLKIAGEAPALARYPESARVFLPDGFEPAGKWGSPPPRIKLGKLEQTLRHLAEAGPRDFYEGAIASALLADAGRLGSRLAREDLADYRASVQAVKPASYRGATVHAAPALTAGPTLERALALLEQRLRPVRAPDATTYDSYASCLLEAYAERLATLGDTGQGSCTTHLSVVDAEGNLVALTQTLLSVFGSKVMLPQTGILMNNGIMWFDPRPGGPNAIAPGKRPLSNMCPTVVERADGLRFAVGASGGRRIMPTVLQLISFLVDFGMNVDEAFHQPRIDVSGTPAVTADARLAPEIIRALATRHPLQLETHGVYPALFACPNLAARDDARGESVAAAYVPSPWAKVSVQA